MKYLSIFFILIALLLSDNLYAYDIAVENADGVTIYYNYINDGTELEVSALLREGMGREEYWDITSIVIPDIVTYMGRERKVTRIGARAFSYLTELKNVVIGNNVTYIDQSAFKNCPNLSSVVLGNSVSSIGSSAFKDCSSLKSISFPDCLTFIGNNAFSGCKITSISLPNSNLNITNYAFEGCPLESITFGSGTYSFGKEPFGNPSAPKIIIKDMTSWCHSSFNSLSVISNNAILCDSEGLEIIDLVIPEGTERIGEYSFSKCKNNYNSITIPRSLKSIGEFAFENLDIKVAIIADLTSYCNIDFTVHSDFGYMIHLYSNNETEIKELFIPEGVKEIKPYAFYGYKYLTAINFPKSLEIIGKSAFSGCENIVTITIPEGVKSIGNAAFQGIDLYNIYSHIWTPFSIGSDISFEDTFTYNTKYNATLYVPKTCVEKYKNTTGWQKFKFIEEGDYGKASYNLIYTIDGNEYKSYEIEYGSAITPEAAPTKDGYTFNGWSEIPEKMPSHDVTITGTFTKDPLGKCATPTISFQDGKVKFNCETDGVQYHYDILHSDVKSGEGNNIELSNTYTIKVYATKDDYEDSDVATLDFKWDGGDLNGDRVVNAADIVLIVNKIMDNQ